MLKTTVEQYFQDAEFALNDDRKLTMSFSLITNTTRLAVEDTNENIIELFDGEARDVMKWMNQISRQYDTIIPADFYLLPQLFLRNKDSGFFVLTVLDDNPDTTVWGENMFEGIFHPAITEDTDPYVSVRWFTDEQEEPFEVIGNAADETVQQQVLSLVNHVLTYSDDEQVRVFSEKFTKRITEAA